VVSKNYKCKDADNGSVYLFCDEFTNWNDTEIGIKSIQLLQALKYDVKLIKHSESGRAAISKGLLLRARKMANSNVRIFKDLINEDIPLVGIEPSAILSFRDEYPKIVDKGNIEIAKNISKNTFMIEEFLAREAKKGKINSKNFSKEQKQILLHGHCHQKSLGNIEDTIYVLSLPEHHHVSLIPSGCCGMAGSFGYEKEHFEVSQQIGNLVLFPAIKKASINTIVVASGTSCRHQILDATQREVIHPIELLWSVLSKSTY